MLPVCLGTCIYSSISSSAFLHSYLFSFFYLISSLLILDTEAGVECTYPVAEGLSSGLLLMFAQVFGIIITLVLSAVQHGYPSLHLLSFFFLFCFIFLIVDFVISFYFV